jgi:hypothetical protein
MDLRVFVGVLNIEAFHDELTNPKHGIVVESNPNIFGNLFEEVSSKRQKILIFLW